MIISRFSRVISVRRFIWKHVFARVSRRFGWVHERFDTRDDKTKRRIPEKSGHPSALRVPLFGLSVDHTFGKWS